MNKRKLLLSHLDNLNIKKKLVFLYILCVFIPIIFINIVFWNRLTYQVSQKQKADLERIIDLIELNIGNMINESIELSSMVFGNEKFLLSLDNEYSTLSEYYKIYYGYLGDYFDLLMPAYTQICSINIYVENETIISGGRYFYIDEEVKKKKWYIESLVEDNCTFITASLNSQHNYENDEIIFSLIKKIDSYKRVKILKVDFSMKYFRKMISQNINECEIYLYDNKDNVIFYLDNRTHKEVDSKIYRIQRNIKPSKVLDSWNLDVLYSNYPFTEEVKKQNKFIIVFTIINLLAVSSMLYIILNSFTFRLNRLVNHIKKMGEQEIATIEGYIGNDEIGYLIKEFNEMAIKIKNLIDNVYAAELENKTLEVEKIKAELGFLESQINPHFLYNTLHTISVRSLIKKEDETAKIIIDLSHLFRRILKLDCDMITLDEEIDFIEKYLEIQKYRYGDEFSFIIENSTNNVLIPKMLLQVFVENSCIHGLENKIEHDYFVEVKAVKKKSNIAISIFDNGVGIKGEKLDFINKYINRDEIYNENSNKESIGIINVIKRMKAIYGKNFYISFQSEVDKYTRVVLIFPDSKK